MLSVDHTAVQEVKRHVFRFFHIVTGLCFIGSIVLPLAGCSHPNNPPEIISLTTRSRVVAPGDSVLIECTAADADQKDKLAYEWSADRGTITGYEGVVAWTAPAEEGLARITVTVSDRSGEMTTQSVAVIVKRNSPPVIQGVTADLEWVPPGGRVALRCVADDGDDDSLSYGWSPSCGVIEGEGDTVTWVAPETEMKCTITVIVDDGYDGRATGSVSIVSSRYEPLLVKGITVTPIDEPPYIVARTDWYKVYWEDSYAIECFVPDPDRIVLYEWSDGGAVAVFPVGVERIVFEGGPSKIRWTAPKAREELSLTVTVHDVDGNIASKTITLYVDTCTCAFPKSDQDEPGGT